MVYSTRRGGVSYVVDGRETERIIISEVSIYAAAPISSSSTNACASITRGMSLNPISRRYVLWAPGASFHTIVSVAVREPGLDEERRSIRSPAAHLPGSPATPR